MVKAAEYEPQTVGSTTPMDRMKVCAVEDKQGRIVGVPCGNTHRSHTHLFDTRQEPMRCLAYPKCTTKLKAVPIRSGGRCQVSGRYVVVRSE